MTMKRPRQMTATARLDAARTSVRACAICLHDPIFGHQYFAPERKVIRSTGHPAGITGSRP
jgi:hypothetical protein